MNYEVKLYTLQIYQQLITVSSLWSKQSIVKLLVISSGSSCWKQVALKKKKKVQRAEKTIQ